MWKGMCEYLHSSRHQFWLGCVCVCAILTSVCEKIGSLMLQFTAVLVPCFFLNACAPAAPLFFQRLTLIPLTHAFLAIPLLSDDGLLCLGAQDPFSLLGKLLMDFLTSLLELMLFEAVLRELASSLHSLSEKWPVWSSLDESEKLVKDLSVPSLGCKMSVNSERDSLLTLTTAQEVNEASFSSEMSDDSALVSGLCSYCEPWRCSWESESFLIWTTHSSVHIVLFAVLASSSVNRVGAPLAAGDCVSIISS